MQEIGCMLTLYLIKFRKHVVEEGEDTCSLHSLNHVYYNHDPQKEAHDLVIKVLFNK